MKYLPGYFKPYYVSRKGIIYTKEGSKLSPLPLYDTNGYLSVSLQVGVGEFKLWRVNRLVALNYIPNPNDYNIVCHKDNNKMNNHVSNLYWGTQKMNMEQASRDGLFNNKGFDNPASKLTKRKMRRIDRMRSMGLTYDQISIHIGLSRTCVRRYLTGITYSKL